MAEGTIQLPADGTGKRLRTVELTVGGQTVEQEVVTLADSAGNLLGIAGTWGYASGSLTSAGSVTGAGKCIGISVFANGVDSSFNVNGGATITVRSNTGKDIDPQGSVTAPVVNWVSGSIDVVIQGVS